MKEAFTMLCFIAIGAASPSMFHEPFRFLVILISAAVAVSIAGKKKDGEDR